MALLSKPKEQQARLVYTSATPQCFQEHEGDGKIFAVIGPFDNFDDKTELQAALKMLMRGWNIASDSE